MLDFIKKNIFICVIFIVTLSVGFLTFLTFINKSFLELNQKSNERWLKKGDKIELRVNKLGTLTNKII